MSARRRLRWLFGLLVVAVLAAAPSRPADAVGLTGFEPCLAGLNGSPAEPLSCRISYRLDDDERANLFWITGGALLDAACELDVALTRGVVVAALLGPTVLEVPAQNGTCRVTTVATALDIAFLLAPTVWFEDGRAIRATPNLHAVRGLPTFLSDALVQAVNQDAEVEAMIVAEVNALLDGLAR